MRPRIVRPCGPLSARLDRGLGRPFRYRQCHRHRAEHRADMLLQAGPPLTGVYRATPPGLLGRDVRVARAVERHRFLGAYRGGGDPSGVAVVDGVNTLPAKLARLCGRLTGFRKADIV